MDDLPVGGGGGNKAFMEEQPPAASSASANNDADKPLEERLVSKAWASRKDAYVELMDKFKKSKINCADDLFREHAAKFHTYLADINPAALEKALECFTAFLDKIKPALLAENQIKYFGPLIEKCLGNAKANIKTKGIEVFLTIFEVSESFDEESMDALIAFCKHKVIKVSRFDELLIQSSLFRI